MNILLEKPGPTHLRIDLNNKHFPPKFIKELALGFYEDVKVFAIPSVGDGRIVEWRLQK